MILESQFEQIAVELSIEKAIIKAVHEVEASGNGFLSAGKPKILFEGHWFWRLLKKNNIDPREHIAGNEDIVYQYWDKSKYVGGHGEYLRLEKAKKINEEIALMSASWGAFQIMGFNYREAGYASVYQFVEDHKRGEYQQLLAFVRFIKHHNYTLYLRSHNWAGFSEKYNGPGYAANQYDIKLEKAYIKHVGESYKNEQSESMSVHLNSIENKPINSTLNMLLHLESNNSCAISHNHSSGKQKFRFLHFFKR